jgi:hypothetical protein
VLRLLSDFLRWNRGRPVHPWLLRLAATSAAPAAFAKMPTAQCPFVKKPTDFISGAQFLIAASARFRSTGVAGGVGTHRLIVPLRSRRRPDALLRIAGFVDRRRPA